MPPDQWNLQPGTLFAGDFRVVRSLSAGGMGAVYVAEQLSTGKSRALKVMLPQLVADPSLRARFEQEARIASRIESEHVVEVVGAGVDAGSQLPWLAMELLSGEDLAQLITRHGPLPAADVGLIFEQLCHAVGAAHHVGVVHRDLKPENVFLAQARRAGATFMVKVLDFGIAKIVAEASTKQTAAMGSPIWMAPEQADQSPITPATDVWALGLIAYYLLTARSYWKCGNDENATIPQVLKEVLFEPIVPASSRTAELGLVLPNGFDAWFARCVVREASARFPDAGQAGAALVSLLGAPSGAPFSSQATEYAEAYPSGAPLPPSAIVARPSGVGSVWDAPPTPLRAPGSQPIPANPPKPTPPSGTAAPASFTLGQGLAPPPSEPVAKARVPTSVAALILVAVLVVGMAAAGGVWWATKRDDSSVATAASAASAVADAAVKDAGTKDDQALVLEAKRLCDEGKCDAAHTRLLELADTSEARKSIEFKATEFKWATETLLLADRAGDVATKRSLLQSVADSVDVDDTTRATARERLDALPAATGTDAGVARVPAARGTFHTTSVPEVHAQTTPAVEVVVTPAPSAVPVAPPPPPPPAVPATPQPTVAEMVASNSYSQQTTARSLLQPKVAAGTASIEEIRELLDVCRKLKDGPCVKQSKKSLSLASKR